MNIDAVADNQGQYNTQLILWHGPLWINMSTVRILTKPQRRWDVATLSSFYWKSWWNKCILEYRVGTSLTSCVISWLSWPDFTPCHGYTNLECYWKIWIFLNHFGTNYWLMFSIYQENWNIHSVRSTSLDISLKVSFLSLPTSYKKTYHVTMSLFFSWRKKITQWFFVGHVNCVLVVYFICVKLRQLFSQDALVGRFIALPHRYWSFDNYSLLIEPTTLIIHSSHHQLSPSEKQRHNFVWKWTLARDRRPLILPWYLIQFWNFSVQCPKFPTQKSIKSDYPTIKYNCLIRFRLNEWQYSSKFFDAIN